jgi:hypothetical protein
MVKIPPKDKRVNFWEWPAYLIDIYRIFPRIIFIVASVAMWKVMVWYMFQLPALERTTEVSAFVAVAVGAWVKLMDYYMQRGVDWSKRLQINGGETHVASNSSTIP